VTAASRDRAQDGIAKPLSRKEERAAREAARRLVVAKEAARIEADRAAKAAGTPGGTPAAAAAPGPVAPLRTDADRARDAAAFLRAVLMPMVALLALPFGYRLDLAAFTDAQAAEDARAWVPLLAKYGWLDRLCTWAGAPARIVARVRELARKREPEAPAARVVPLREGQQA